MKKKTKLFFWIIVAGLFFAFSAKALELNYPSVPGAEPPQVFMQRIRSGELSPSQALPLYAKYFYHLSIALTGIICLYAMIHGGIVYLFSLDNPGKKREGLNRINMGFLGAAIIIFSYLILNVLDPALLIFNFDPPGVTPLPPIDIPGVTIEGPPVYVEVPLAGLTELVQQRSSTVNESAARVESASRYVRDIANCLNALTAMCQCGRLQTLSEGCEDVGQVDTCPFGQCDPEEDPCDIDNYTMPSACTIPLPTDNLRSAVNNGNQTLRIATDGLFFERAYLEFAARLLEIANYRLKAAETLIMSSRYPAMNRATFATVSEREVEKIFPYERFASSTGTGSVIEYPSPPAHCQGECPYEIVPSCAVCGGILFCYGNGYRCCDTGPQAMGLCDSGSSGQNATQCIDPPPKGEQEGCCTQSGPCYPPRSCAQGEWLGGGEFPTGTILYNSMTFPVPAGGVYICDSNVFGCSDPRCGG